MEHAIVQLKEETQSVVDQMNTVQTDLLTMLEENQAAFPEEISPHALMKRIEALQNTIPELVKNIEKTQTKKQDARDRLDTLREANNRALTDLKAKCNQLN